MAAKSSKTASIKPVKKMRPLITNDEIDLIAVWERIVRGWVIIAVCVILGGVVGAVVGMTLPEKYEVRAILEVPDSWNASADVVTEVIKSYVESEDFLTKGGVEYSVIAGVGEDVGYQILLTTETKNIDAGQQLLKDVLRNLQADSDLQTFADRAMESLEANLVVIDAQLIDAYEKQALYANLLQQGDASVIVGSNPIEINQSILELELEKEEIERSIALDSEVYWTRSPSSNGEDVQLSTVILAAVGAFVGGGLGFMVVLLKKWK